jgi:hypothetical protein
MRMNCRVILGLACLFICVSGVTMGDYCDAGYGCDIDCEFGCGALIAHEEGDPGNGTCYTFCADENGNELANSRQGRAVSRSRSVGTVLTGNINASLHNITLPRLALAINQTSTLKAKYNETQLNATINNNFNNTTMIELINSTGLELVG